MNRYMLEEFHNDPALYRRLAEREQARAIGAAFAALPGALARLFGYLKARLAAQPAAPGALDRAAGLIATASTQRSTP